MVVLLVDCGCFSGPDAWTEQTWRRERYSGTARYSVQCNQPKVLGAAPTAVPGPQYEWDTATARLPGPDVPGHQGASYTLCGTRVQGPLQDPRVRSPKTPHSMSVHSYCLCLPRFEMARSYSMPRNPNYGTVHCSCPSVSVAWSAAGPEISDGRQVQVRALRLGRQGSQGTSGKAGREQESAGSQAQRCTRRVHVILPEGTYLGVGYLMWSPSRTRFGVVRRHTPQRLNAPGNIPRQGAGSPSGQVPVS